jgi:2-hydroxy-3-keto-5-methylthiopentenyl-1-phosphate phosphatase
VGGRKFIFCEPSGKTGDIKYILGPLSASSLRREVADRDFEKMRKIFVSDYDGTITDRDFYSLLAERYAPADTPDYFARYREGRLSHFEAMEAYFAFAPTGEEQLEELLEASQADPDLGASARLLHRAGWELVVVSAGSSWYVERVLSRAGVAATVYSNPGRLENGRGLVLEKLGPSSPFHSASVGVDKSAVVRHCLRVAENVAFAGDGSTDLQPALLIRPEWRFARGFLAEALRQRAEAFRPFSRWSEIVRELV